MPDLDALLGAHDALRETIATLGRQGRGNAARAAVIDVGHEARLSLSIALIVRPSRRPAAIADAHEDLAHFARLAGQLNPEAAAPLRDILAALHPEIPPLGSEQASGSRCPA